MDLNTGPELLAFDERMQLTWKQRTDLSRLQMASLIVDKPTRTTKQ